ncbi:hypothetical protein [Flavobacterium sp. FlaQc-48]|uniref:hypothetical protein n=1 Tax=Flavobacterium sp. FlaQc-48 TaxID=3374181 RepID=UPI0037567B7D
MENSKKNKVYTGNCLTTFRGILLMLFFAFVCFYFIHGLLSGSAAGWVGFPIFFVLFSVLTFSMNYFILTHKKLIAKNPIWFWRITEIDFSSITSVSIVQPPKTAISLEVRMESSTKFIPACSLRDNTWKELKAHLIKENLVLYDKVGFD